MRRINIDFSLVSQLLLPSATLALVISTAITCSYYLLLQDIHDLYGVLVCTILTGMSYGYLVHKYAKHTNAKKK